MFWKATDRASSFEHSIVQIGLETAETRVLKTKNANRYSRSTHLMTESIWNISVGFREGGRDECRIESSNARVVAVTVAVFRTLLHRETRASIRVSRTKHKYRRTRARARKTRRELDGLGELGLQSDLDRDGEGLRGGGHGGACEPARRSNQRRSRRSRHAHARSLPGLDDEARGARGDASKRRRQRKAPRCSQRRLFESDAFLGKGSARVSGARSLLSLGRVCEISHRGAVRTIASHSSHSLARYEPARARGPFAFVTKISLSYSFSLSLSAPSRV